MFKKKRVTTHDYVSDSKNKGFFNYLSKSVKTYKFALLGKIKRRTTVKEFWEELKRYRKGCILLGERIKFTFTNSNIKNGTLVKLRQRFSCMKRFTYKETIKLKNHYIDDIGWGCTVRSGQMLIFNMLCLKILRPQFKGNHSELENASSLLLIALFSGNESKVFSFSRLMSIGIEKYNKIPGEFWNAKELFLCVKESLKRNNNKIEVSKYNIGLNVIISDDGGYKEEEARDCLRNGSSLLLVFNLNICSGISRTRFAKELLQFIDDPCFSGMICGKGDEAYYVFSQYKDYLLYLDPHKVQTDKYDRNFDVNFFHRLSIDSISASTTITFLFRTQVELEQFNMRILEKDLEMIYVKNVLDDSSMLSQDEFMDHKIRSYEQPSQLTPKKSKIKNHNFAIVSDTEMFALVNGVVYDKEEFDGIPGQESKERKPRDSFKVLNGFEMNQRDVLNDEALCISSFNKQDKKKRMLKRNESFLVIEESDVKPKHSMFMSANFGFN